MSCKNCKFFDLSDDHPDSTNTNGECHRFPPIFPANEIQVEESVATLGEEFLWSGWWPEVSKDDWCGEFIHRDKKESTSTAFPWGDVSNRTRNSISRYRAQEVINENISWPWTCEDLFKIGYRQLKEIRHFGCVSACEINVILRELGFEKWFDT